MTDDQKPGDGIDPSRYLSRARASLREAAECLEAAVAVEDHSSVRVASALSHVAAARKVIGLYGSGDSQDALQQDVA